jgi:hypothetical protein
LLSSIHNCPITNAPYQQLNYLIQFKLLWRIYWFVNATHDIWFNELYKKEIVEQIKIIVNKEQNGGCNYYSKYQKYKSKYLELKNI